MKQRIILALSLLSFGAYAQSSLTVSMKPWGPTPGEMDKVIGPVETNLKLQGLLGTNYRLLDYRLIDENAKGTSVILPPSTFEALYYNYSSDKAFLVTGDVKEPLNQKVSILNEQPAANQAEYEAAVALLKKDAKYGPGISSGQLKPFQPLPPSAKGPDNQRIVVVGINSTDPAIKSGLVGVNMSKQYVAGPMDNLNYNGASALTAGCNPPDATGCWNFIGFGAVEVVIKDGNDTLWTFHAVRPGSSSGNILTHSGIELRHVRYKGKMVMWTGHMPILNVQYKNNVCGPYRDWMFEESCFYATGTQVTGTGFMNCTQKPTTILENPTDDGGNFNGVAVWADTGKVTLISELEAGWYRYITEWRLYKNGTIEPIIGFGATNNDCTCNEHYHHGYWRLDMDIDRYNQNIVEQFQKPSTTWNKVKTFNVEEKQYRNSTQPNKWRVKMTDSVYYEIFPGADDGTADGDAFAKGDLWFLKYNLNQTDDNPTCIYGGDCLNGDVTANINKFMNNEGINNQDVVIWYGAHKTHILTEDHGGAERRGPKIVPSATFNTNAPLGSTTKLPALRKAEGTDKTTAADKGPRVDVFPNPASNSFDIRLSYVSDQPVSVKVFDLKGRVVFENKDARESKDQIKLSVNSGEWQDGIYIIEVSGKDWIITRKLVKQTK